MARVGLRLAGKQTGAGFGVCEQFLVFWWHRLLCLRYVFQVPQMGDCLVSTLSISQEKRCDAI